MSLITPLHEKMSEVVSANSDAFNDIVGIALDTSEQLFALNVHTLRSFAASTTVPPSANLLEQLSAQSRSPARSLERASAYLRDVSAICIKSQAEIARINVERANELAGSIGSLLDTVATSGPTGSTEMVEQIKSALSSATEAYKSMIQTSGELAERSLAATAEAVEPMAAAGGTQKKVTRKAA